mmetsp:Transcript_31030/g.66752  ORF Transcript_31030/g.66752 Transcript_31030/m.66752 type:complete len:287 (-) Transcript_31030:43-903(-)
MSQWNRLLPTTQPVNLRVHSGVHPNCLGEFALGACHSTIIPKPKIFSRQDGNTSEDLHRLHDFLREGEGVLHTFCEAQCLCQLVEATPCLGCFHTRSNFSFDQVGHLALDLLPVFVGQFDLVDALLIDATHLRDVFLLQGLEDLKTNRLSAIWPRTSYHRVGRGGTRSSEGRPRGSPLVALLRRFMLEYAKQFVGKLVHGSHLEVGNMKSQHILRLRLAHHRRLGRVAGPSQDSGRNLPLVPSHARASLEDRSKGWAAVERAHVDELRLRALKFVLPPVGRHVSRR